MTKIHGSSLIAVPVNRGLLTTTYRWAFELLKKHFGQG